MLSAWLRAIRIRFLLASVIAVSNGLAISYWKSGQFNPLYSILTYAGVVFLHASVDLLNDYWDFRRGIDQATTRTKFSGGTGVLPEKILKPKSVYLAGIIFLVLGASVGTYFVLVRGPVIAAILGFAIVAIYFYSSSIVNIGLGEFFVGLKGAMIVLGASYVQLGYIDQSSIYTGIVIGLLSATVLFVNAFPDVEADRAKGRKTLVIILGRKNASSFVPLLFLSAYLLIIGGVIAGLMKIYCLAALVSIPLAIRACRTIRKSSQKAQDSLIIAMGSTISCSRFTGAILALGFLI